MSTSVLEYRCVEGRRRSQHAFGMAKRRKNYIKEWREFRTMSQEKLGEAADMTGGNVSLIERGLQNYTEETLEKFAAALQCTPVDLLARSPKDSEPIWTMWEKATPEQRQQIIDLAKVVVRSR